MFNRRLLSSSIAMVAALGSLNVSAQENNGGEPDILEEVIVTGIRGSLSRAMDIKRDSAQVVDAIVAEDIGKFPDNNVIEAMQHIPGVQVAVDVMGEAQSPVIRGSADIVTTINGQQVFTGNGRNMALQDIPATMVAGIEVYKSTSADMIEGGVGGAVNIQLRRPFDFDGLKAATAVKAGYNDQSEEIDPNVSGLISNRWDTSAGEFGALLNVSYSENHYREQAVWGGGFFPYNPDGTRSAESDAQYGYVAGDVLSIDPASDYILMRDAAGAWDRYGLTERPAVNVSLQWAPSENLEAYFDTSYQGYEGRGNMSFLFTRTDAAKRPGTDYGFHDGTNVVNLAQTDNAFLLTSSQAFESTTDSLQYSTGIDWDVSDKLNIKADINYQDSEFLSTRQILDITRTAPTLDVDFNQGGVVSLDYGSLDLTSADGLNVDTYFDQWDKQTGDAFAVNFDADYMVDWGPINKVEVGIRYSTRNAFNDRAENQICCSGALADLSLDGGFLDSTPGGFMDGVVEFPREWATPSVDWLLDGANQDTMRQISGLGYTGRPDAVPSLHFDITEDTIAYYGQFGYEFEMGGMTADGLVGARVVDTSSDLNAFEIVTLDDGSTQTNPLSISSSDYEVLPNASIRLNITDSLVARLNGSKTLTRPAFADLNPSMTLREPIAGQINQGTGAGGNPNLVPFISTNIDATLEWYFGEDSYLAGTFFTRSFDNTVLPKSRVIQRNGIPYVLTSPENAGESEYDGYEVAAQYFPAGLPSVLDGLGVQASYTYIDGTLTDKDTGVESFVPNVSKKSYSAALFYEKELFSARVSYVYRDSYKSGDNFCCSMPTDIIAKAFGSTDVSFSLTPMDNLTFTLDATNIFGDKFQDYFGDETLFNRDTVRFSKVISLGVRADF